MSAHKNNAVPLSRISSENSSPGTIIWSIVAQVFLSIVIGVVMAVVANGFIEGARWIAGLSTGGSRFILPIAGFELKMDLFLSLGLAAILILGVRRVLGITAWSGPAESIFAVQQSKRPLDIKLGIGSTMAAFISASGGASVGQYGPLVHCGATFAELVRKYVPIALDSRLFIACGVAGAISAGFNAPIAGVLFAQEALLRRFSIGNVAPIAMTSFVAYAVNQTFFDLSLMFTLPDMPIELSELFPFLTIVAVLSSITAIFYMSALRGMRQLTTQSGLSFPKLMAITVLIVGLIGALLPEVAGLGNQQINQIINGQFALGFLVILLIAKVAVTVLCLNTGFFGGVFGPALFVGAALGGICAHLAVMAGLEPSMSSALSVAAMAAVGASVIGAPLTVIMIVIELTGSYSYGLSAMLCVILCSILTLRFFGLSYFDRQLLDKGIDMRLGNEHIEMSQIQVSEIESSEFLRLSPAMAVAECQQAMADARVTEAYVCDDSGRMVGKIDIHSLGAAGALESILDREPTQLSPDETLVDAMNRASTFVGESIPVIDDGRLVGALTEGDIFNRVLEIQDSLRRA
ncbi:MAG: chloride channel protein [OM182 bacterium]|nr:MAG: chloride channel protein [OM182 bacterium]